LSRTLDGTAESFRDKLVRYLKVTVASTPAAVECGSLLTLYPRRLAAVLEKPTDLTSAWRLSEVPKLSELETGRRPPRWVFQSGRGLRLGPACQPLLQREQRRRAAAHHSFAATI
jgi:hypothetical protein